MLSTDDFDAPVRGGPGFPHEPSVTSPAPPPVFRVAPRGSGMAPVFAGRAADGPDARPWPWCRRKLLCRARAAGVGVRALRLRRGECRRAEPHQADEKATPTAI